MKLQYLTHTSVQFYPREAWDNSIVNVSKTVGTSPVCISSMLRSQVRKFSIAIALVFECHALAFPSMDLVFQVLLRFQLPNFLEASNAFLANLEYHTFGLCFSVKYLSRTDRLSGHSSGLD